MNVLLVAGGTGGHIFPAIAFGNWLLREHKASSVIYVCGNRPLETEIYRSSGISPIVLPIDGSPLGIKGFSKRIKRFFNLFKSYFQIRNLIRENTPCVCFMFGSYVSLPALLSCHFAKIPSIMHEQNAVMGKVARLASKMGKTILGGVENVPVRPFVRYPIDEALKRLAIPSEWRKSKIVGVLGGSLSSGTLTKILESVTGALPDVFFIMLGDKNESSWGSNVLFIGRQWDMNPVFSVINFAVCRGGASTLAELAAYSIPCVVVPWTAAADGHQEANADVFEQLTGNHVWRENDRVESLIKMISLYGGNPNEYSGGLHDEAAERLFAAYTKEGKRVE